MESNNKDTFSSSATDLGRTSITKRFIKTPENFRPVKILPHVPWAFMGQDEKIIEDLPCKGSDTCLKRHAQWSDFAQFDGVVTLFDKRRAATCQGLRDTQKSPKVGNKINFRAVFCC